MKLGVYTAILHDRPLRETLEVIASLGLTGAELNSGGFLPSPHLPVDDLLRGAVTPAEFLSTFDSDGGLDCRTELQRQSAAPRSRGRPGGRRGPP
jgi:sugar phosphate isomerase/epimerase